ncbi:MAG: DUF2470 domain-containing protein [Myxococcota bacterium]
MSEPWLQTERIRASATQAMQYLNELHAETILEVAAEVLGVSVVRACIEDVDHAGMVVRGVTSHGEAHTGRIPFDAPPVGIEALRWGLRTAPQP